MSEGLLVAQSGAVAGDVVEVGAKAYRVETDALGAVLVPADRLWGAQTQRSLQNFAHLHRADAAGAASARWCS